MHVKNSLSDVAASNDVLPMNLQPLAQENETLVESNHTGGFGEDCVLGGFRWGSS